MSLCDTCKRNSLTGCLGMCSCGTYHWRTLLVNNNNDYNMFECNIFEPDKDCPEYISKEGESNDNSKI